MAKPPAPNSPAAARADYLASVIGVVVGAALIAAAITVLHEGWAIAVGLLGVLMTVGAIGTAVQQLLIAVTESTFRRLFAGYDHARVPIGEAQFLETADGDQLFAGGESVHWLGMGASELFLIRKPKKGEFPWRGGQLTYRPNARPPGGPLAFRLEDIRSIRLFEIDQAQIEDSARDKRDTSDKVAEAIVNKLVGLKYKKFIPMAAHLEIIAGDGEARRRLVSSFPTEIDARIVAGMKLQAAHDWPLAKAALDAGIGYGVNLATDAVDGALAAPLASVGGDVIDFIGALNRPAGSTNADTAKALARLVLAQLNHWRGQAPETGSVPGA